MFSPEDLTAKLPPPRDDEPESLRRDIIDELADHLQCALHRELLKGSAGAPVEAGASEAAARDRVLWHFGNPAHLARRLWWDAMQEIIMSQRILLAASIVAASAASIVCVLAWQAFGSLRDHQSAVMAQQQAANERIVEQLATLLDRQQTANGDLLSALVERPAASPAAETGWQHLRIRVVDDQGAPQQLSVTVQGTAMAGGELSESVGTDAEGVADFGQLPPGEYRATCYLSDLGLSSSTKFLLGPGRTSDVDILCPSGPPPAFDLKFVILPPEDLKSFPLHYLADLSYHRYLFEGERWNVSIEEPVLLLGPDGTLLGQTHYSSVAVSEPLQGSGLFNTYSISFLEELSPEFSFDPVEPLPAYEFGFELWPYVALSEESSIGGTRPPLKRLTGAALRSRSRNGQTPVVGEEFVVTIDDSHTEFWNDVRRDLARFEGVDDGDTPAETSAIE